MGFGEYLSLAPEARVGGRSVLLIPARAADLGPDALPADYQRLLTIVRDACAVPELIVELLPGLSRDR